MDNLQELIRRPWLLEIFTVLDLSQPLTVAEIARRAQTPSHRVVKDCLRALERLGLVKRIVKEGKVLYIVDSSSQEIYHKARDWFLTRTIYYDGRRRILKANGVYVIMSKRSRYIGVTYVPSSAVDKVARILKERRQWLTIREIASITGLKGQTVSRALRVLKAKGVVEIEVHEGVKLFRAME
ncbi:MAG: hypothetical protein DRN15_00875 [Thermoprotei archaeon]|nr:MAG: hypothetical protein DRN15_00875 [Thermoprotei archaeon]